MRFRFQILPAILPFLLLGCVCAPTFDPNGLVQLPCCYGFQDEQQVNISTGIANWVVTVPGATVPEPVWALGVLPAGWATPPSGLSPSTPPTGGTPPVRFDQVVPAWWIRPNRTVPSDQEYVYETTFTVPDCIGYNLFRVRGVFAADGNSRIVLRRGSDRGMEIERNSGPTTEHLKRFESAPTSGAGRWSLRLRVQDPTEPVGAIVQAVVITTCRR